MDKNTRARMIVDHAMNLDDRFSRVAPPRSANAKQPCRIISDDARWQVRLSCEYEKDETGTAWDLFELFLHGQPRMTAAIKGEDIRLRLYVPGSWEQIFTIIDPGDTVPLMP